MQEATKHVCLGAHELFALHFFDVCLRIFFFGKSFAFNLLLYYAHCSITFLQKNVFCSRSPNSMETFFFVDIGRYVFCVHVQHTHAFIQVEWSFFKKSNSQDYFYISCLQFTIFNEFFFSFRCRHSCYAAFQKKVIKREREKNNYIFFCECLAGCDVSNWIAARHHAKYASISEYRKH